MKAGDLLIRRRDTGWSAVKLLAVDRWSDGSEVFHCCLYEPVEERPAEDNLESLRVSVMHAPIAAEGYRSGWEVLCSCPVADDELEGFHEYLKLTDFARFASVTGQDVSGLVARANDHYRRACALGDIEKRAEAIEEYSKAIDIFPLFYEAIDNRAFTYMELGDYVTALRGFEESLRVNPEGQAAFFSRGECLMKLGMNDEAAAIFREGAERFPDHRELYLRYLNALHLDGPRGPNSRATVADGKPQKVKPWWQFW